MQEIQDADGTGNGTDLSGFATAARLIEAIRAAGGPGYVYVEIAPATAGTSGGEPGGNIRNGYLYNPDRVGYIAGSATLLTDAAFDETRRPLVADFTFNGEVVRLINVHFTSRGGSDPLFGANQPPANEGDAARIAQGTAVANYVNDALATDPSLRLGVLGDFNGFYFEDGLQVIEAGGVMTNLYNLLAPEERYSYMFDGNLQALDAVAALHRRSRQFRPPRRERDGDRPLYLYDHRCCRPQQHGQRQRDRHGGARRRPRRCRPW